MSIESKIDVLTAAILSLTKTMNEMIELQKEIMNKGRKVKKSLSEQEDFIAKKGEIKPIVSPRIQRLKQELTPKALDDKIIKTIRDTLDKISDKEKGGKYIKDITQYVLDNSDYKNIDDVKLVGDNSILDPAQKLRLLEHAKEIEGKYLNEPELL